MVSRSVLSSQAASTRLGFRDRLPPVPDLNATCWSCGGAVDASDRYCRHCGQGQGAFLAWYYRPLWIALLALTALGPFVLPLVWRTPRLDRTGKWVASIAILAICGYLAWEFVITVREIGRLLTDA